MRTEFLKTPKKKKIFVYALSFLLPFLCMLAVYALFKVYPFGGKTVLVMDMDDQYGEFLSWFRRVLTGRDSLFYSFNKEMGGNTYGLFAYYLSSPFSLLMLFFPQKYMPIGVAFITLVKIGACGLTFAVLIGQVFKKYDPSTVLFSCIYALMSYSMMYAMCIMWLDAVIWLPIIILGIERVLRGKSPVTFIAAFALTLISNYYTAYMSALFAVIFFLFGYFSKNGKMGAADFFKKAVILIGSGAVSLLLACFILVPAYINILSGKLSGGAVYVPDGFFNRDIFEIPRRLFIGQYDSITNIGSPGIFCGMLCGAAAVLYFFNSRIKLKAKLSALFVFAALIVSFFIKDIDIMWHVFKYPNWFPYRYAYVFCFFAVFVAYSGFVRLRGANRALIAVGAAVYAALLLVVYFCDSEVITNQKLAVLSLVLAAVYIAGILAVCFLGKKTAPYICCVFIALTCVELTANGLEMLKGIDGEFGYTDYSEYSSDIEGIGAAADYIKARDDGFYRAEKTFLRSDNDGMSFGLKGMTHYSSTYNSNVNAFALRMGMRQEYICSRYHGSTILTDALLGVKYVISKDVINDDYERLDFTGENRVYENPYALPIGYAASDKITGELADAGNALDDQNYFAWNVFGRWIFKNVKRAAPADGGRAVSFTADETGEYYIDFAKNYNGVPSVSVNGASRPYQYDTAIGKKVFYLGRFNAGDNVKVGFTDPSLSQNARAAMIQTDMLEGAVGEMNDKGLNVTKSGYTYLEGDVTLGKNEVLFITIPYEKGWTAYVDGKKTEPVRAQSTFMAVPAGEGEHHVKLKFRAPGFAGSLLVSLLTLAALLAASNKKVMARVKLKFSVKK